MATYKLIQDIEAEDHILGPLTLRQFIYSLVTVFLFYICFLIISKHVDFLLILFLPPALFSGFLAFPFKRDQPTEVWALAKVRFLTKPRKRIWSQSGIKELVTVTAPKKISEQLTNGLSQNEVRNRLQSLATMIDSRGWAVKNIGTVPEGSIIQPDNDERLITAGSIPKPVLDADNDIDIFSDESNQSLHAKEIIDNRSQAQRQHLLSIMEQGAQLSSNNIGSIKESSLSDALKNRRQSSNLSTENLPTIETKQSVSTAEPKPTQNNAETGPQTHIDPAVLSFALNNSGLSVQTLAKEANRTGDDKEVVINLH